MTMKFSELKEFGQIRPSFTQRVIRWVEVFPNKRESENPENYEALR